MGEIPWSHRVLHCGPADRNVGGELFTGNNLVMAFGAYDKSVSWKDVGKVWGISYIGNFVGCLILALIFVGAGASGTADYFAGFNKRKTEYSGRTDVFPCGTL